MEANAEACEASVEKSLSMVTSLNPHIGYEKAAALAKEAFKTGKTIRELCREQNILPEADAEQGARSVEHDRTARVSKEPVYQSPARRPKQPIKELPKLKEEFL